MQRRGAAFGFLMITILTIIGFLLFAVLLSYIFGGVDDETSEFLCETVNAGRFGLLPSIVRKTTGGPQACRVIDKETLPTGRYNDYSDKVLGEKQQIADMITRCWDMWLKGIQQEDGTNAPVLDPALLGGDKQCFVCYLFHVSKPIASGELSRYLATAPYSVKDTSNKCVSTDTGGSYCLNDCNKPEEQNLRLALKEVKSTKCPGTKCCVPVSRDMECVSRGGTCAPPTTRENQHTWRCPKGQACYVDPANFLTYEQYVRQGGRGVGIIDFSHGVQNDGLQPGTQYAVIFNEDTTYFYQFKDTEFDTILVADYKDIKEDALCKLEFGASGK